MPRGLDDTDFYVSSRVSVGVHHHTSPAYFYDDREPPPTVELPDDLDAGALYAPIVGRDLVMPPPQTKRILTQSSFCYEEDDTLIVRSFRHAG